MSDKYSGLYCEALDEMVGIGFADAVLGDVEDFGHYALIIGASIDGEEVHAIVYTNSQGFVDAVSFDSEGEARMAWDKLEGQYDTFCNASEED